MGEAFIVNSELKSAGFTKYAAEMFAAHKYVKWTPQFGEVNSWPMKKTWRMWMSETAKWMADKGATMPLVIRADGSVFGKRPFNSDDAHELWVSTWMGVDDAGKRYKTAGGDKGEMLQMMNKHLMWAAERGLNLTIPKDGEYQKLQDSQNR